MKIKENGPECARLWGPVKAQTILYFQHRELYRLVVLLLINFIELHVIDGKKFDRN